MNKSADRSPTSHDGGSVLAGGPPSEFEIVIHRVFNAPLPLVWRAWTDAGHQAKWFGPKGFTTRVERQDLRVGGKWRLVMVGPDGTEYPCHGVYRDVVPFERIVSTDEFDAATLEQLGDAAPAGIVVTTLFEDLGGKTGLTLRISHPTIEDKIKHQNMGVVDGWGSSLDKLETVLAAAPAASPSGEIEASVAATSVTQTDRQITLSREFDAPRALVWKVWTDPTHLARWWGPVGFRTSTSNMEFRPGGQWRFVMHGPDGTDYQNLVTYLEVREPDLIRYKHGGAADVEPINFEVTARFEEVGTGRTRLTMRMEFGSAAAKAMVVQDYGAIEGGKQTLGRLAEHLAGQARSAADAGARMTTSEPLVISRVVRAPRQKVWEVWTTLEHLEQWFGPSGTSLARCSLDMRPGGAFHYLMRGCGPAGDEVWARWIIRDVRPLERLEVVISFSNEAGGITRAPWDEQWPLEMLASVTFHDHAGKGRGTVVRIEVRALGPTAAEQAKFDQAFESMRGGWGGTLDRLETYAGA